MDIPEKYKQLWSEWDIRILILLSLFIQIILIFLGRLRKTSTLLRIRIFVWSSYLLANWVADFTLGQLSSSMGDSTSSDTIIAFWAPFLILHLGGPNTITAYSMEDNELWGRHLLGLGYELIVAFYVLFLSLPNTRLLAPTLLIFLVAIIKYVERSYSLYKASNEGFRNSISSSVEQLPTNISSTISKMEDLNSLNEAFKLYSACKHFFVNSTPRVEVYEEIEILVKEMTSKGILRVMGMELSYVYDELYTKAAINHSRVGYVLRALCSICILLAFLLYVLAPKDSFDKLDVAITYVLLAASIFLDTTSTIMLLFSDWMLVSLLNVKRLGKWSKLLAEHIARIKMLWLKRVYWSGEMPQLNLISNCLENFAPHKDPQRRMIKWIEEKLSLVQETKLYPNWSSGFENYTLCTLQPIQATQELQEIIFAYVKRSLHITWEGFDEPAVLSALQQVTTAPTWAKPAFAKLIQGLPLDQQVLVWHITTELCFHWKSESLHPMQSHQTDVKVEDNRSRGINRKSPEIEICKYLSNYMMHMVLMRPEIMSTMGGSSPLVFWRTCYDIVEFIRRSVDDHHLLMPNAKVEDVCKEMMTAPIERITSPSFFEISRVLSHLMLVIEDKERWEIITTAWVELLMQGAKNSKANMHVKQLSRGGELLTFIWLLTKHLGMADSLYVGAYITSDVLKTANHLLPMIKLHLQNQH